MSDLSLEEIQRFLQLCKTTIKTYGYMLQGVDAGKDTWPFVYSAGRAHGNLPDFIVFGSADHGHLIKEVIVNNISPDTVVVSDVLICTLPDGTRTKSRYTLKRVGSNAFSKYAYAAFNPDLVSKLPVEIYQIFLSDKNNLLPGEPGHSDDEQPRLWLV